ncbi:hypothetical protein K402DRAFT_27994 [Aulographum hederae CBS 113979]|uniref:Uncharacterized protein n=1 Tax=Aulographum hederae CBS 113979 TaxID=1176131 RepID=A0A6G1H6D6_9PEZI|nr:hypothetical protein K402DRAFT_27994 [Aulographum hederae CBS 113979]
MYFNMETPPPQYRNMIAIPSAKGQDLPDLRDFSNHQGFRLTRLTGCWDHGCTRNGVTGTRGTVSNAVAGVDAREAHLVDARMGLKHLDWTVMVLLLSLKKRNRVTAGRTILSWTLCVLRLFLYALVQASDDDRCSCRKSPGHRQGGGKGKSSPGVSRQRSMTPYPAIALHLCLACDTSGETSSDIRHRSPGLFRPVMILLSVPNPLARALTAQQQEQRGR